MASLVSTRMKPGTTPILNAVVGGVDITEATVYIAIETGDYTHVKSNKDNDDLISLDPVYDENEHIIGTEITAIYTQEETLQLSPGNAKIEIGWVFDDDSADKTNIGRVLIPKTLIKGVMRYGRNNSETI